MAKKPKHPNAPSKGLGQKEKQFLHLKEFSLGKPNELSLNVLEQKAAEIENPDKKSFLLDFREANLSQEESGAEVSLSADGNTVTGTNSKKTQSKQSEKPSAQESKPSFLGADSQTEIARRQHRRRGYRRLSIAVVLVLCVCALGFGGSWAYQQYERISTNAGMLKEACSLIEQSDDITLSIDEYFQTSFNEDTVTTATELLGTLDDARSYLNKAKQYATDARDNLDGSAHDKEAAERALNTIAARETLLDTAEQRLNDDIAAKQAIDALDEAQSCIDEGNALLVHAASVVSNTTEDNVNSSTKYTTSAQEKFSAAKAAIENAQNLYPSADCSTILSYVEKRLEAASEALLSNAAILLQDRQTAETHNDAYNAADQAATALAKDLPSALSQAIVDAYAANEEPLQETYNDARNTAASNDSFLRDYLGTN